MSDSKVYQIVTDRIVAQLKQGTVPWRKPWKSRAGVHIGGPANLVSRRFYRGLNSIMLSLSGYGSPYWLTYKQAQEMGGTVRKGEHSTPVTFWKFGETEDGGTVDSPEPMQEKGSKSRHRWALLRYYNVFNVEQCDGLEKRLPKPAADLPPFDPIPACESVVSAMPKRPPVRFGGDRAYYAPSSDYVQMPDPRAFIAREHYYSTLFHELAHSTGHPTRLERTFGNHRDDAYAREELVAELTAAMVCGSIGLDPVKVESIGKGGETLLDSSAAYIATWIRRFTDQPREVVLAGAQAQKAADWILNVRQVGEERIAA